MKVHSRIDPDPVAPDRYLKLILVMDLSEKICLITGSTSGIGKETALELARMGMHIVMNTRDEKKGKMVQEEIIKLTGNQEIDIYHCDLASFESIRHFAATIGKKYERLDILINNAGLWINKRSLTADGIELHFAVNHLAPFLLTHYLLNLIKKSPEGRIINVSSGIHYRGFMDLSDPEFQNKKFNSINAYTQSKLANILFTRELALRLKDTTVTVNCLAPGWVNTGLFREANPFVKLSARLMALTPRKGAENTLFLATSSQVSNITGEYFEKKKVKQACKQSYDKKLATDLWKLSEKYLKNYLNKS